jgi:hypothetical protein
MSHPDGTQDAARWPQDARPAAIPAEPATAQALWPTFMRRTLDEDVLHPAEPPARRQP